MIEQALEELVMPLDQPRGHWIVAIRREEISAPLMAWKPQPDLWKPTLAGCVKFIPAHAQSRWVSRSVTNFRLVPQPTQAYYPFERIKEAPVSTL
jgi:hypothetical protein